MNFFKWWSKNKEEPSTDVYDIRTKKDFSSVGLDHSGHISYDANSAVAGINPTVLGTNNTGSFISQYGGFFGFQGGANTYPLYGMHSLIRLYAWMAQDPDIRFIIDEVVNEATMTSREDEIITLDLSELDISDSIKDKVQSEFRRVLELMDFKNSANNHLESFYINGRSFYKIDIDKNNIQKGIEKIKLIMPYDIIAYFDDKNQVFRDADNTNLPFEEGYVFTENAFRNAMYTGMVRGSAYSGKYNSALQYIAVPKELVVYQHSGILDWQFQVPLSYLHLLLKTLNSLRNLKDALVIYRMTRAPERFVFNIEVGKMQQSRAEAYVAQVARRLKQDIKYDPATGEFKEESNKMNIYKDWFFPKVMGQGTEVDVLQAGQMQGQLEEAESFLKMLMRQANVPYSRYLGEAQIRFGGDGEIERDEIKFYKFIKRNQMRFNKIFFELLQKQLSFKNIIDEKTFESLKYGMTLKWGTESLFNETKETALFSRKAAALGEIDSYVGKYSISEKWVKKNVLKLSDEEIEENEKLIDEELKKSSYREQVKNGDIKYNEKGEQTFEDTESGEWISKAESERRKQEAAAAAEQERKDNEKFELDKIKLSKQQVPQKEAPKPKEE